MCTSVTEKQTFGPGPYGYDSTITTRGKIHTPACAITGRHSDKGLPLTYASVCSNALNFCAFERIGYLYSPGKSGSNKKKRT